MSCHCELMQLPGWISFSNRPSSGLTLLHVCFACIRGLFPDRSYVFRATICCAFFYLVDAFLNPVGACSLTHAMICCASA